MLHSYDSLQCTRWMCYNVPLLQERNSLSYLVVTVFGPGCHYQKEGLIRPSVTYKGDIYCSCRRPFLNKLSPDINILLIRRYKIIQRKTPNITHQTNAIFISTSPLSAHQVVARSYTWGHLWNTSWNLTCTVVGGAITVYWTAAQIKISWIFRVSSFLQIVRTVVCLAAAWGVFGSKLIKQKIVVLRQFCNNSPTFMKHFCNLFVFSATLQCPVADR